MVTYRVTAAAVLVRLPGADLIIERGRELPAQAPADLVDRLLRKGMIEPIEAETPEPAVEPDAPAPRKGRTPPRGKAGAPADSGKELANLTVDQLRAVELQDWLLTLPAATADTALLTLRKVYACVSTFILPKATRKTRRCLTPRFSRHCVKAVRCFWMTARSACV